MISTTASTRAFTTAVRGVQKQCSSVLSAEGSTHRRSGAAAAVLASQSNSIFLDRGMNKSMSGTNIINFRSKSSSSLHKRAAQALKGNLSKQQPNNNNKNKNDQIAANNAKPGVDQSNKIIDNKANAEQSTQTIKYEVEKDTASTENKIKPTLSDTPVPPPSPASSVNLGFHEFAPRICVIGVGGAGGNAVNNMIASSLTGVDFLAINTDAQHLSKTLTDNRLQIGVGLTGGLGCGANPDAGRLAAEESKDAILERIQDAHMVFITAGMGGGTGTGAAPVVADICYNAGILTVGVITKPFRFEGTHRMRLANEGISRLTEVVDTMIVIPNQNLFGLVDENTSLINSFALADDVLLAGVKSVTDLMTSPGLINLDFADVQSVMHGMGNAMLGSGQADGEDRAMNAAEQALSNPLLGDMDIGSAKGMLVNITGGSDMTLFEVDKAAQRITEAIQDEDANIIFGSAYDASLDGSIRVSVVATGIEKNE